MKIKGYHSLAVLLIVIMGLHLFSCQPRDHDTDCPEPPETVTVDLPQSLKDIIPYHGLDTLMFIRKTSGDTHTFIGQGVKRGYILMQIPNPIMECPSSKGQALMEYVTYRFVSPTFTSSIILEMAYIAYPVRKNIFVKFNNKTFDAPTTIFTPFAKDSLVIAGKMYNDVATIADDLNPISESYYTLFNAKYGILKFRFQTGEEWELLPKP